MKKLIFFPMLLILGILAAQNPVIIDVATIENQVNNTIYGACIEDVNHEIYGGLYDQKIFGESFEEDYQNITFNDFDTYGGYWSGISSTQVSVLANDGAKLLYKPLLTDGSVEVEMKFDNPRESAALIVRTSNAQTGADNFNGYEIGLNAITHEIILGKHVHNWQPLGNTPVAFNPDEWTKLRVELTRARIRIYVNDAATPNVDYTDTNSPLLSGKIGIRTWRSNVSFRNLRVKTGVDWENLTFDGTVTQSGMWDIFRENNTAQFSLDSENAFNGKNAQKIVYTDGSGKAGLINGGLNRWGIAVQNGKTYTGRIYLRSQNFAGKKVYVALQSADGKSIYAMQELENTGTEWAKFPFSLTSNATDNNARFAVWIENTGTVWLDQVVLESPAADRFHNLPVRADIGNAMVAQGLTFLRYGDVAAEYTHYIERFNDLYTAMKAKDPDLKFINAAWWRPESSNVKRVFDALNGKADYWDYHPWTDELNSGKTIEADLRQMQTLFKQWDINTTMKCAIFEENGNTHNLQRAIVHASVLNAVRRMGDFVLTSCAANALQPYLQNDNGWDQGQIFFTPAQVWGQPTFYAQQMAAANHLPQYVKQTSRGLTLDVTATTDENNQTLVIHVVNLNSTTVNQPFELQNFNAAGTAQITVLQGNLNDENTPGQPEKIVPQQSYIAVTDGRFTHIFPPRSYTIIRIEKSETAQTWTNPLTLNGEWSLYGIGDPYIMKYRGIYYLYCSTKDNNTGVKCWSTKDFITWSNAYMCSNEAITKTAYAPEVVYWNGKFYMYTSPGGGGHYVLSSDSPTGPFTVITGNLGKVIDGSVFIEDDGKWYFYHADNSGIMGCPMSSPTSIGAGFNLNAKTGYGWTEGPTVIKRNGIYYLIYTGNHVISKGYRIDYALNTTSPLSPYTSQSSQNPILISSEGSHVGLGHGSAFIGPDLDSYYYVYHNLAGDYGVGPYRRLNFDRIAWNGNKLLLLGPTTWAQQGFKQADMSDFFERDELGENWLTPNGGSWTIKDNDRLVQELSDNEGDTFYKAIYNQSTGPDYIAEFTVKKEHSGSGDARFGTVFGYTDEANYGIIVLNNNTNRLEINFKTNNQWDTPQYYDLPDGYKLDVWHTLRMEKTGTAYKFFIDGMHKATITNNLGEGKIGYATSKCRANFGYIAFNNQVNDSGILDVYKPIPGLMAALHYTTKKEEDVSLINCNEGGNAIISQKDEWYEYNVNVKATGLYHLGLRYSSTQTAEIRVWQGDTDLTGIITLPTTGSRNNWRTFTIKNLKLQGGFQTLRIETVNGNFNFYEMQFEEADDSAITLSDTFDTAFSLDWNYVDGSWRVISGEADIDGFGKRTIGNSGWTDYTVQVDVTYYNAFNAGLIFRVNNPALGGAGNDPGLGTDYLQGYFVSLSSNGVILGKHNYNWTQLAAKTGETYVTNKKYTLKVEIKGPNIKVYVDNMETPKIDYTDTRPFICGKVGLRVCSAHVHFDNFSVTTTNTGNPNIIERPDYSEEIKLFPNPVSNELIVQNILNYSELHIYNIDGKNILNEKISGTIYAINTSAFDKGLYLLRLTGKSKNNVIRKFIKK
jgi:hypothetical protein